MKARGEKIAQRILLVIALSAISSLILIALFIFKEGTPVMLRMGLRKFLFSREWDPQAGLFGIYPMIAASLWVTLGAMLIGAPLGIAGAIFLNEFVPKTVLRIVKPAIELLAGIPSVVYGFIGVMVLAPLIRDHLGGPGLSILAAAIILGVMILPTVISISTDAIGAVPNSYREGALALGATRWQAVHMVILKAARSGIMASIILAMGRAIGDLKAARSGIMASIILAMGRAIGETMAVIMVAGNTVKLPHSVLDSARTLTATIAFEMASATGRHREALFAIGVVLFVIIMILNTCATVSLRGRTTRS
ncbi:MAG: phosphate ABC transporter permease subunit PstC [Kiritimatiellaeota bacterium]|nr:phosphate ABC transporter permease subunit PstC [Kiritimatiellota bacterium]